MTERQHLNGYPGSVPPPQYTFGQPGTSTANVGPVYGSKQGVQQNGFEDIPDIEAYERSLRGDATTFPLSLASSTPQVIDDQTPLMSPVSTSTKVVNRNGVKVEQMSPFLDPECNEEEPEEGVSYPDPDLFDTKNTIMTEHDLDVLKYGKNNPEEYRKKLEVPDASSPPNKIVEFLMYNRTLKENELQQINAYRTKRNRLSLNLVRLNPDREFDQKACESLVKKLKDKKHDLQNLIDVVHTKGTKYTGCITIPRTLDGRLQVHGRKGFPHVVYGKLWRFSEMTKNETRHVDHCKHAFEMKTDAVCVNPYHYEIVIGTMIVGQRESHDSREMSSTHTPSQRYHPNGRPSADEMSRMNIRPPTLPPTIPQHPIPSLPINPQHHQMPPVQHHMPPHNSIPVHQIQPHQLPPTQYNHQMPQQIQQHLPSIPQHHQVPQLHQMQQHHQIPHSMTPHPTAQQTMQPIYHDLSNGTIQHHQMQQPMTSVSQMDHMNPMNSLIPLTPMTPSSIGSAMPPHSVATSYAYEHPPPYSVAMNGHYDPMAQFSASHMPSITPDPSMSHTPFPQHPTNYHFPMDIPSTSAANHHFPSQAHPPPNQDQEMYQDPDGNIWPPDFFQVYNLQAFRPDDQVAQETNQPLPADWTPRFFIPLSKFRTYCRETFTERFFDASEEDARPDESSNPNFVRMVDKDILGVGSYKYRPLPRGEEAVEDEDEDRPAAEAPYSDLANFVVKVTHESLCMSGKEPPVAPDVRWGVVSYYEEGDCYIERECYRGNFHIDSGFIISEQRLSLGLIQNPSRSTMAFKIRKAMIDGIRFSYKTDGSVWLQNNMRLPIFVTSGYLDDQCPGIRVNKVHKLYGHAKVKVFGFTRVKQIIRDRLYSKQMARLYLQQNGNRNPMFEVYHRIPLIAIQREARVTTDSLVKYCCVKVSFGKGFGDAYPERPIVSQCPVWLELKINSAFDYMDAILNDLENRFQGFQMHDYAKLGVDVSPD
ncbi:CRE-DAF-3 protein [Caenorhabditis remanei]|uniref:CRE-DAF-3 protein n=1 Tax=Caenorhabditis remanei TaxID=31234 RepID=E3MA61_CAERE|nr:CRE-DAF-3 protein [Caenorhabditis remanei]